MKNEKLARSFLKSLILTMILLLAFDSILYILELNNTLDEPYNWGSRNIIPYKINGCKKLFDANPDRIRIIGIGDSRLELGFDPYIIDNNFENATITYNIGLPATEIMIQSMLLQKIILKKFIPDLVIWQVGISDFHDSIKTYSQFEEVTNTPMGRYHTNLFKNDPFVDILDYLLLRVSNIYQYRETLLPKIFNLNEELNHNIEVWNDLYDRGAWIPEENLYSSSDTGIYNTYFYNDLNNKAVKDFNETIDLMDEMEIDYLIVAGPYNHEKRIYKPCDELFASLPPENFLNLNGNESLMNDNLYYNGGHLNREGANIFTNYISQKLSFFLSD